MNIFHFFAGDAIIKIKLAFAYEPSILKNYIEIRPYNAFLYIRISIERVSFSEKMCYTIR